jgi:hypothetical protein
MLWRRKWSEFKDRQSTSGWQQHEGWFTGLACLGSAFGALAYGARLGNLTGIYGSMKLEGEMGALSNSTAETLMLVEQQYVLRHRFAAAFYVLYPWEAALVVLAQLFVLQRMRDFAIAKSIRQRRWIFCSRLCVAVVIAGNLAGICSNLMSASLFNESANLSQKAVESFAVKNTAEGLGFRLQARDNTSRASANNAIARFCEAIVLLVIVAAYSIVGVASARIIASALLALLKASQKVSVISGLAGEQSRRLVALASEQGRQLQRKIVGTFVFVFIAVLLRSSFYVLYAIVSVFQNTGDRCGLSCDPCHNDYAHIYDFILYTPEFQQTVMIIASPGTLLLALWGMSGVQELEATATVSLEAVRGTNARRSVDMLLQIH